VGETTAGRPRRGKSGKENPEGKQLLSFPGLPVNGMDRPTGEISISRKKKTEESWGKKRHLRDARKLIGGGKREIDKM